MNTIKMLREENQQLFKNIVGQEKPKRELGFYLDSYLVTQKIPNLFVCAPRGQGKTTISKEVARGLYEFDEHAKPIMVPSTKNPSVMVPKRKPFIEVNCSSLTTLKAFFNSVVIPFLGDKPATVFMDEASEIPDDITMALLTMLNPNPENRNTFTMDSYACEIDFKRHSFILATSEPHKVFEPLKDRLERITLQEYSPTDLSKIVRKGIPHVKIADDVIMEIASTLRGNARAGQKMAEKLDAYLRGRTELTEKQWQELQGILSIAPLGLNGMEIQILRLLADNPEGTPLTALAAKMGMSRESLRQDVEMYLQKHGLMEIETTGRKITPSGLKYLKNLPASFAPVK